MNIIVSPQAIGWKHNHVEGIKCAENKEGDIELVEWPSSLGIYPTQAQADVWTQEYSARDKKDETYNSAGKDKILKALILVCADQFGMTPTQIKIAIKTRLI